MERVYMKPIIQVIRLQHSGLICTSGGQLNSVQTTGFDNPEDEFIFGGGGNGPGR